MHGNTGSRAREHRLNIYHIFQELDYHTIAFDYRGNVFFISIQQYGLEFENIHYYINVSYLTINFIF